MAGRMISVNIALAQQDADAVSKALTGLSNAGLEDAIVLEAVGIVTGRVAQERLDELRRVPGVTVEVDETIDIGPPIQ